MEEKCQYDDKLRIISACVDISIFGICPVSEYIEC